MVSMSRAGSTELDVNDVLVVEAADNVYDCVDLADMGQELIAQTLALACAAGPDRPMYYESTTAGVVFFAVIQIGQRLKTLIRYRYHADVGSMVQNG